MGAFDSAKSSAGVGVGVFLARLSLLPKMHQGRPDEMAAKITILYYPDARDALPKARVD